MAPELSVVIVSYNDYRQTTGPCLRSLLPVRKPEMELVVVDNGSDRDTREGLALAARADSRIRLVLNDVNRGYAGGNNDGVAASRAEHLVLLNSDTRVLSNSLELLVSGLKAAGRPRLLGPVTNAAGTEQQIDCPRGAAADILEYGQLWSRHARDSLFPTDTLTFFCVALHRSTYEQLGGLDESFGLGFYEDTDFCRRAASRGIALHVLEESFIYHQGSGSFSRSPAQVKRLLRENRRLFIRKHGRQAALHVREKNMKVLDRYVQEMGGLPSRSPALAFRFANRCRRALQLAPRNAVKRVCYHMRLRQRLRTAAQAGYDV